ncbi:MAG: hypothetical protein ISQ34_01410 [Rickettsiales bacterium]|nr:hypothetical protein [Rickettsiales bacterium]
MQNQIIDVVIPAHEKDNDTLEYTIKSIKKNIQGIRRVIVVSKKQFTKKAEFFDEAKYPFSYQEISDLSHNVRVGWHYQQLLKLYAIFTIPDISDNVLIVDADTVFYKKVKFFENQKPLYNLSKDKNLDKSPFHQESLAHITTLIPEIANKLPKKYHTISGVCHHMLFQRKILEDLFKQTIKNDNQDKDFYKIFLKHSKGGNSVSEYNLYFYFLMSFYQNDYQIRILKYKNCAKFNPLLENIRKKYHYCSYHDYMRKK